jgi:uncharacterized membrane protein YhaH (DUF805 family)
LKRTITGAFVFSGRSRRLEVGWYWLFSMIAGGLGQIGTGELTDWEQRLITRELLGILLTLPLFALFARRLHDQGCSGWWVLFLPPLLALNVYNSLRVNFHAFDPAWPAAGYWHFVMLPAGIVLLLACVMPGEGGRNKYGADPRLAPEQEPSVCASDVC